MTVKEEDKNASKSETPVSGGPQNTASGLSEPPNTGEVNVDPISPVQQQTEEQTSRAEIAESKADGEEEETICQEYEGGLNDDKIAGGLSQLGRSADGTMQVYLTLFLPGSDLTDITPLGDYVHLQTVILSHNSLTDLTALGNMPNLITLDVSHNKLTTVLDFTPPLALREVNLSHNEVEELPDLSLHHSLVKLNLNYNKITEIQGLSGCHKLSHLLLMHNRVERIANLENLLLHVLDLSHNNIKKIENLETLKTLQKLNLASNCIRSMKGLQGHPMLQEVDLQENQIIDIAEVRYIRELKLLRNLNLQSNPIQSLPDYRLSLLFRIQTLLELDKSKVTPEEKIAAMNMYSPPMEVVAARDHMLHVVRSLLQPVTIYDSTLPSVDTPYPMLILCGPSGAGKRHLARRLCQEFPDFFGIGVSHTTRPPRKKEEHGQDYFFVNKEEFEHGVMSGLFLETCQVGGFLYGVTREAVECVAREGLAAVFTMELEGVLSFKNTYFEPRYVLVVPINRKAHEGRMQELGYYSEAQITHAIDRVEMYLSKHRDNPGFFDMAINSDDLNEAYRRLKHLIMEYLGMSPPTTTDTDMYSTSDTSFDTEDDSVGRAGPKSGTTNTTSMTINMAARTWSRRSHTSSTAKRASAPEKTPVEERSHVRRQILAKAAVAGVQVLSLDQLDPRHTASAGFTGGSSNVNGVKRASSYPLDYTTSFVSMVANASSGKDPGVESNESDSEGEGTSTSSLMSSARAYSARQDPPSQSQHGSDEDRQSIDIMNLEFASQASASVAMSSGMVQLQDAANSI
ncbi:leucine-rich repeat and guanylate kinase domain-containing protein [Nematostella vectensis]|uniref:leucine-rich repeat and guanylate kinase domain-containing protein n=1 Tax=Nematostella vectensis TaxID=45351 RepID=UPI0013903C59|nr:leucine-rich repeat and guanylate kinase domain-containing protein [Nematostella vectensis]